MATPQNIGDTQKIFGFFGGGIIGSRIVKNLRKYNQEVIVWDPDPSTWRELEEIGALVAMRPCDVAEHADIIFSCVSDPDASIELALGDDGIFSSKLNFDGKGYVEMTGLDVSNSQLIADAVVSKGGRYLEVPIQGSRIQAEDGLLILIAAGDRTLFDECHQLCFEAMAKNAFFLGDDIGNASIMYLTLQIMSGVTLGGLVEALALAQKAGLYQKDVLEIFESTNVASSYLIERGTAIVNQDFTRHHKVTNMQKDLQLALSLGEEIEQNMPITAATNEVLKCAKQDGFSQLDISNALNGL